MAIRVRYGTRVKVVFDVEDGPSDWCVHMYAHTTSPRFWAEFVAEVAAALAAGPELWPGRRFASPFGGTQTRDAVFDPDKFRKHCLELSAAYPDGLPPLPRDHRDLMTTMLALLSPELSMRGHVSRVSHGGALAERWDIRVPRGGPVYASVHLPSSDPANVYTAKDGYSMWEVLYTESEVSELVCQLRGEEAADALINVYGGGGDDA